MARRKDGGDETRVDCDALDRDHDWQAIYAKLRTAIGDHHAYNWFGHCRYLSCHGGMIRLEHWCAFAAKESLARHGYELCKAANVLNAAIRFNGGTVPHGCTARKSDGYAQYTMPGPVSASTAEYRMRVINDALNGVRVPAGSPYSPRGGD